MLLVRSHYALRGRKELKSELGGEDGGEGGSLSQEKGKLGGRGYGNRENQVLEAASRALGSLVD